MNSKVIVDSSASKALLALAFREGLLTETENNDEMLASVGRQAYPSWLITQALEQVVLFEQVHLANTLPRDGLKGELLDTRQFHFVNEMLPASGNVEEIDPAILNGMFKARGLSPTPFENPQLLEDAMIASRELEKWEALNGEKPPSRMTLLIKKTVSLSKSLDRKYAQLDDILMRLEKFQPFEACLRHYLQLVTTSQDRQALMMAPIYPTDSTGLFRPNLQDASENTPTVLLRLTSAQLGVLPYGQSLRSTLAIANDPATHALRFKIDEWISSLPLDSGTATESIQKEIHSALKILNRANIGSTISNITTYIGVPLALVAPISQFATALGWIATVAGTIGLGVSHAAKHGLQWATFGSGQPFSGR